MSFVRRYLVTLIGWTVVLMLAFTALAAGSPAGPAAALPASAGLALVLAAFPAGIVVSGEILPDGPPLRPAALRSFGLLLLGLGGTTLLLTGFLGPMAYARLAGDAADPVRALTLVELRSAIREAEAAARQVAGLDPTTIGNWLQVNTMTWEFFVRVSAGVLAGLFGLLGLASGFWARRLPGPEWRLTQHLTLGLVLTVATYLSNENGFEWIVLQAAGPVPFAGLFSLVVPSLLCVGVGWPTVLEVGAGGRRGDGIDAGP